MTRRTDSDLEQQVSFNVMRAADAAFVLLAGADDAQANLVNALRASGLRVTASGDELIVSHSSQKVDTLELAKILREKGSITAVVVPVVRQVEELAPAKEVTAQIHTHAGTLSVSLVPSVVALDGRPLGLTRTEERLLARLWGARGRAVPAVELAAAVWPGDGTPIKALRVHLSKLRPKLVKVGLQVETLKGLGYRLRVVPPAAAKPKLVKEMPAPRYRRAGSVISRQFPWCRAISLPAALSEIPPGRSFRSFRSSARSSLLRPSPDASTPAASR
jgi:DNA-binding winged helix-turn-helix (wHTH) protein